MRSNPVGTEFYKKKGFDKSFTIHLPKDLHARLQKRASQEERSIQTTVRLILEQELNKSYRETPWPLKQLMSSRP